MPIFKEHDYTLIPMKDIDPIARKIAVSWIEGLNPSAGIEEKHKLASDLMNYHLHMNKVDEKI